MAKKISHLRLLVTELEKPPQEMIDVYVKGAIESADKGYKRLKEVLPNIEAVIEKIIKPSIKGTRDFLNPDAYTRSGMKVKNIPPPTRAEMERRARKYLKRLEYAFRDGGKEWAETMKYMAEIWGKSMLPTLAIKGYKDKIRGVGPVAARWLTGDELVLPLIFPKEIIKGPPVDITKPGQAGRSRSRFISQLVSDGSQIIKNGYQPGDIIDGNANINGLVNSYARDEFVPFTPNGASHVDFIVELSHLFLDIQVSVP